MAAKKTTVETIETANVEVTTPEVAVVETAETEVAVVETEEKVTFMQKAADVCKKHGKKIALGIGAVALGVAAYALGKKSGSADDFEEFDYDFDGDLDVAADVDFTEVADTTEE